MNIVNCREIFLNHWNLITFLSCAVETDSKWIFVKKVKSKNGFSKSITFFIWLSQTSSLWNFMNTCTLKTFCYTCSNTYTKFYYFIFINLIKWILYALNDKVFTVAKSVQYCTINMLQCLQCCKVIIANYIHVCEYNLRTYKMHFSVAR